MINSKLEILRNDLKYRDTFRIITSVSRYVSYRVMSVSSQPYLLSLYFATKELDGWPCFLGINLESGVLRVGLIHVMRKPTTWFLNRSDTNWSAPSQKMVTSLKFWI